eukprot:3934936-Rhodomonas_salina.2
MLPEYSSSFRDARGDTLGTTGLILCDHDMGDHVSVAGLVPGGSAESCGLIDIGDVLVSINGRNIAHLPHSLVAGLLVGPPGSRVSLSFLRTTTLCETSFSFEVELTRAGLSATDLSDAALESLLVGKARRMEKATAAFQGTAKHFTERICISHWLSAVRSSKHHQAVKMSLSYRAINTTVVNGRSFRAVE